ncbi:MAG: DegQ family serine endoprotease [Alphaproteobacteria bacterium]|nr:DegQ family serine endoprotease [Alphaproteobacteria bacterium]
MAGIIPCLAALGLAILAGGPVAAEVPSSRAQIGLSFAPLVKQVAPAVVNIYTRRVVHAGGGVSPLLDDPIFRHFFGDQLGMGGPSERVEQSLGSGVLIRANGIVVTNRHVIKDSDAVTVVLADRREFEAKIVGTDERTDLAVLKIDVPGEKLPVISFSNSDDLEVGDLVLAIGNPFGVGQTVTSGIVSALARTTVGITDYRFFIQTDAAINPGNSGGALVTVDGALAGINTAIYSKAGGNIGIGFAIPANMVRTVVEGILSQGHAVHPWIGASTEEVTPDIAETLGLPRPTGALVTSVRSRGPAAEAGLRPGDVVVAVNGRDIDDPEAMRFRIATLPTGGEAQLKVVRRGAAVVLTLRLMAPPETPPREPTEISGRNPFSGAVVANLNPALAEELGLNVDADGVIIVKLKRNSLAYRVNLRPGDIVLEINGEKVDTVRTLARVVAHAPGTWRIAVRRGDSVLSLTVKG